MKVIYGLAFVMAFYKVSRIVHWSLLWKDYNLSRLQNVTSWSQQNWFLNVLDHANGQLTNHLLNYFVFYLTEPKRYHSVNCFRGRTMSIRRGRRRPSRPHPHRSRSAWSCRCSCPWSRRSGRPGTRRMTMKSPQQLSWKRNWTKCLEPVFFPVWNK